MYSCNSTKRETVIRTKTTAWAGFDSVQKCRFDQRYTEMHQKLGCDGCVKDWDWEYLKKQGLMK